MVLFSRFFAPVVALSAIVPGALGTPITEPDDLNVLEDRAGGHIVVTGVKEGGTAPRLEIRDLAKNHYQWNLFLLAFEAFQHQSENDKSSFYKIAGIHGKPYNSWDGANGPGGAGYCPHVSNMFGPWHRPYLALLEQRIHAHAVNIAGKFGPAQRGKYREAAKHLRLPYWDWASKRSPVLPHSLTSPKIKVTRPNGKHHKIPNPLYAYRFHPLRPGDLENAQPYASWKTTKRAPTSDAPNAKSRNSVVQATIGGSVASYRSRVYSLLVKKGTYNGVSNSGSGAPDTIESVHDNIHGSFGFHSHMSDITVSSYDPIFFLHHCNVDRLLAIWQHLHPHSYVKPHRQQYGTYWFVPGSTQGPHSALKPFRKPGRGVYWTAKSVRNTKEFGYTYPELKGGASKKKVRARINREYGPRLAGLSANITDSSERFTTQGEPQPVNFDVSPEEVLHEYVAQINLPSNPFSGPYSCSLFLGSFSASPVSWPLEPSFVGTHDILGMPGQVDGTHTVAAQFVLTAPLLERYTTGELEALDMDTILEFLRQNLRFKMQKGNELLDAAVLPAMSVQLLTTGVKSAPNETEFPDYLDTSTHWDVPEGIPMGTES